MGTIKLLGKPEKIDGPILPSHPTQNVNVDLAW